MDKENQNLGVEKDHEKSGILSWPNIGNPVHVLEWIVKWSVDGAVYTDRSHLHEMDSRDLWLMRQAEIS